MGLWRLMLGVDLRFICVSKETRENEMLGIHKSEFG